jgi:hypothetical protein
MDDTKITRSAFVNFICTLVIPYKNHLLGLGLAEVAWAFDLSIRPYLSKLFSIVWSKTLQILTYILLLLFLLPCLYFLALSAFLSLGAVTTSMPK